MTTNAEASVASSGAKDDDGQSGLWRWVKKRRKETEGAKALELLVL
jgi:hypothetical protein